MSEAETEPEGNGEVPEGGYNPPAPMPQQGNPHGVESKEFVHAVTDYELEPKVARLAGNIISRKLGMTNFTKEDVWEHKFLTRIDTRRARASYPPPKSCMRGGLRKYVYGDNKRPLTEHEKNQLQAVMRDVHATLRQGENGWLLEEVISKVKQENKQVAERVDNNNDNETSLIGKILP